MTPLLYINQEPLYNLSLGLYLSLCQQCGIHSARKRADGGGDSDASALRGAVFLFPEDADKRRHGGGGEGLRTAGSATACGRVFPRKNPGTMAMPLTNSGK